MKFVEIICVGGVLNGKRVTRDDLTFDAQGYRHGTPTFGGNMPPRTPSAMDMETTVYEITALDIGGTTILFYKDMGETLEGSLQRIMDGYNPRYGY